ncbi:MAG: UTP--glucose-1-phosphate uridylyltransferase [Planctomycetes bacterium]|nr:UTP--glucose-1-phosphate uridylyltransferase [Planctomycetota bacterium]
MTLPTNLVERLRVHRQDHLLRFWNELTPTQRDSLVGQLQAVDFEQLARLWQQNSEAVDEESPADRARRARPPRQVIRVPQSEADRRAHQAAYQAGLELLRSGRVGVILVAGGEGSRLGFPHPKGQFPIGPVSNKSLFQMLAEQVVARSREAGAVIPYYIMTSDATHDETVEFFLTHRYFGLNPRHVHFFRQGTMPAVDLTTGRLLLGSKHELVLNPDGHGGILRALDREHILDQMCDAGVDYLYYHQVDNPLARVCDPVFLGYHAQTGSELSTKVVAKLSAAERMGVIVEVDGLTQIIEYSDMPADVSEQVDSQGGLQFWAGNTAIHIFSRDFLTRLRDNRIELPFHRAIKKVPHLDEQGLHVQPANENAVKFERFIFDVLPLTEKSLVYEARREDEFCPLKNKTGDFSQTHVQASLSRLHASWLRAAGVEIASDALVEISPLFAVDPAELAARVDRTQNFDSPLYLSTEPALSRLLNLVIMAGGSGTRFWPESRRAKPKQFLTLAGDRSLIQQAADRCHSWVSSRNMHVVTNAAYVAETLRQLPQLTAAQVIAEPCGRNTAPCIGLAAWQVREADPNAILLITPADHLIRPEQAFRATVERAVQFVTEQPDASVLIGIPPQYPATGYGYIERGAAVAGEGTGAWSVARFREKPDVETAREFLSAGTFLWNSGIFVWRAARILELLAEFQPAIYEGLSRIAERARVNGWAAAIDEGFAQLPSISIDHGVLEPLVSRLTTRSEVFVVSATFDWDDVGSWQALPKALGVDDNENAVLGTSCVVNTKRCVIRTTGDHLVATIGLEDFVVVHTPDATLVAPQGDEAALRQLVKLLEERGFGRYL